MSIIKSLFNIYFLFTVYRVYSKLNNVKNNMYTYTSKTAWETHVPFENV
jgi:hypothetical protein